MTISSLPGGGSQPTLNVVLFRHGGRVLVAVLSGGYDPPTPSLDFLRYERGHWQNVGREVLPEQAWDDLPRGDVHERNSCNIFPVFRLPRNGTTIQVIDSGGATDYLLIWKNGRFTIRE